MIVKPPSLWHALATQISVAQTPGIEVILGEGVHSTRCELKPTANGKAFAGSAMGREIVYERSVEDVAKDLVVENHDYRDSRRR